MADRVPGVYTDYVRTSDLSANSPNNRCLIAGLVAPGALATPGVPFLAQSSALVDSQCGGAWTHAARLYRAARAQAGAELWVWPLADPAGTKATRILTFGPSPTYDASKGWIVGTATTAAQASQVDVDVAGQVASFSFQAGDSWATIAAAAQAALAKIADLIVVPTVASATLTLTDRHAAELGNDLPVRIGFSNPSSGCAVQCGLITLATTATGAGTVSLTDLVLTAQQSIAIADTAVSSANGLRDSINATLPCRAAVPGTADGTIVLYHRDDRYVRHLTLSITAAIGTTAALTVHGVTGVGVPVLTGAGGPLSQLAGDQAYKTWAQPFADTTSLSACIAQIVAQDASPIEKGQVLVTAISTALPLTPLTGATTPTLTSTELAIVLHAQGATVRAGELAARVAAEISSEDDYGRNYNGLLLKGPEEMPLSVPHRADRSGRDAWNAAISTGYAPVAVNSANQYYVVDCCTTFASGSAKTAGLTKWSGALIPIYLRASLRQRLTASFFEPGNGKSVKAHGRPRTDRAVTALGVRSEVLALIDEWDAADLFDYSSDLNAAIAADVVSIAGQSRIRVGMPFRTVRDLDRVEISAYPAA